MPDEHRRTLPDLGLLALPGDPPSWIWAFTCPMPRCKCRTAIVLSVAGDRGALLARGAPVREAWLRGDNYANAADAIAGGVAFAIDIDSGDIEPVLGDEPLDVAGDPIARAVVERIDGETLEEIGRVWHLGKGRPDPAEESRVATSKIALQTLQPGDPVGWQEAIEPVRRDVFAVGDRRFEAVDARRTGDAMMPLDRLFPELLPAHGSAERAHATYDGNDLCIVFATAEMARIISVAADDPRHRLHDGAGNEAC